MYTVSALLKRPCWHTVCRRTLTHHPEPVIGRGHRALPDEERASNTDSDAGGSGSAPGGGPAEYYEQDSEDSGSSNMQKATHMDKFHTPLGVKIPMQDAAQTKYLTPRGAAPASDFHTARSQRRRSSSPLPPPPPPFQEADQELGNAILNPNFSPSSSSNAEVVYNNIDSLLEDSTASITVVKTEPAGTPPPLPPRENPNTSMPTSSPPLPPKPTQKRPKKKDTTMISPKPVVTRARSSKGKGSGKKSSKKSR